ncbi:MAG: hypothetical protein H7Y02_00570, partial [Candidatus Obscuribacterales bacterium]|nr:hypothetical protein [Steroidobacteraceae bacterium]
MKAITAKTLLTALVLTSALGSLNVQAAPSYLSPNPPPNSIEDRFRLEVDLLRGSYDTQLRFDPTIQTPGTTLSAEDDLGLDDSQLVLQLELTLLPGKHHLVRLHGLSMRRDGFKVLNRTVVFDTSTYNAGERV